MTLPRCGRPLCLALLTLARITGPRGQCLRPRPQWTACLPCLWQCHLDLAMDFDHHLHLRGRVAARLGLKLLASLHMRGPDVRISSGVRGCVNFCLICEIIGNQFIIDQGFVWILSATQHHKVAGMAVKLGWMPPDNVIDTMVSLWIDR